jgi:hypothetical protein
MGKEYNGNRVTVRGIIGPPALPVPAIVSFTYPASRPAIPARAFVSGMTIRQEPRTTMNISLRTAAAPVSASVTFGYSQSSSNKIYRKGCYDSCC